MEQPVTDQDQSFLGKITRGLKRDRDLPLQERLKKGFNLAAGTISARLALRDCNAVGSGARVTGRLLVVNHGHISVGSGFVAMGQFVPVELLTGRGGRLEIGDGVWANFGCVFSAKASIRIGAGSHFGQHCIIADSDTPEVDVPAETNQASPIEIGKDVWIAGRVTVRPGVKIGDRAVITAGSVVETDIPAGVVAGGIPARVLRSLDATDDATQHAPSAESKRAEVVAAVIQAVQLPPQPPLQPKVFGSLVSDFTIDELAEDLRIPGVHPPLGAWVAPFNQVAQTLLSDANPDFADFAVVWVRPETTVPSFARIMAHEDVSDDALLAEVDAFSSLVESAAAKYKYVFVPSWTLPPWRRGLGMMDSRRGGVTRALLAMNLRLADNLARTANVFVLNAQRWFEGVGPTASAPRAWYLGKMSASRAVMTEAAADIQAAVAGLNGAARKLLVVDLDDTLWGGIVGDAGWEGLRLGGHDAEGEAHVDFQRAVKQLQRRGVILGIVSKNEESVALEAIRKHPEMVLREDDFVGWKINWTDKAKNIVDLASELNLGLQSVVFIDDNPVERARVREALPEVLVPEWPQDKHQYALALHQLRVFDAPALSAEDLARTRMYQEERQRDNLQKQVGSIDEWLKGLQMQVRVEPLTSGNLTRAAQLLNKTNQLNLTTRRMTEAELLAWTQDPKHVFWTVSVSDRFGDAGLTGLVSVELDGEDARLVDYVLSCRVMGRRVEETMLHVAAASCAGRARRLTAKHLPTAKNKPCLSFFERCGFTPSDGGVFDWDLTQPYGLPDAITLSWER
jgi:FkbH-like protein